jgi:hypothetical protein
MTDPTFSLRGGQTGPLLKGTPANVLAFGASGEKVGGVTPGGGAAVRLPGVAYVDASNAQASPDGSAVNPFRTVTAAIAAVTADGLVMSSVLVFPGDYSAEPAITWAGGTNLLLAAANGASRMWQGSVPLANLPDIALPFGQLQCVGLDVGVITDTSGIGVTLIDCTTRNSHAVASNGGLVMMSNCMTAAGSVIRGQGIRFRDCELGNASYSIDGSQMVMQGCVFDGAPTIVCFFGTPGALTIDGWSKALLVPLAPALTNIAYDLQNALA